MDGLTGVIEIKQRRMICCVIAICFVVLGGALLTPTVSAHSGRTDGKGGHNSSSGYHYHHGYPAHDHKDMDGDGDKDCPYDFDDQTGKNSGSSGSNGSSGSSGNSGSTGTTKDWDYLGGANQNQDNEVSDPPKNTVTKPAEPMDDDISPLFFLCVLAVVIYLFSRHIIKFRKNRAKNKAILQKMGLDNLKIPIGVWLQEDGPPISGRSEWNKPYGGYTVYRARSGTTYHRHYGCSRATGFCHVFEIPEGLRPCKKCVRCDARPASLPEWYIQLTKSRQNSKADPVPEKPPQSKKTASKSKNPHQNNRTKSAPEKTHSNYSQHKSSFIDKVEYSKEGMKITFSSGSVYLYYNVPRKVYEEMIAAPSLGHFFHERIKSIYPYTLEK